MKHEHNYSVNVTWTGNLGSGTSGYQAYSRDHEIRGDGKAAAIAGSSDPVFRGDGTRWNPEELLVSTIATCHMLWYLHLAADAGIVVVAYEDSASGAMVTTPDGGGKFTAATLRPRVAVRAGADVEVAMRLHERAHRLCFIANSVSFPVGCEPEVTVLDS